MMSSSTTTKKLSLLLEDAAGHLGVWDSFSPALNLGFIFHSLENRSIFQLVKQKNQKLGLAVMVVHLLKLWHSPVLSLTDTGHLAGHA